MLKPGPINGYVRKIRFRFNPIYGEIDPRSHHSMPIIGAGRGHTDGSGFWSEKIAYLNFEISVDQIWNTAETKKEKPDYYGQLNAYFDPKVWDTEKFGLIYTDKAFDKSVSDALRKAGFKYYNRLETSEQGMQGDNFVNYDLDNPLAAEILAKGYAEITEN